MLRCLVLMVFVLGACATDAQDPEPTPTADTELDEAVRAADMNEGETGGPDVCALAAALPAGDICHHVCDPDAMAAQLIAEGNDLGYCYQLYCQLTDADHVLASVCLAP